METGDLNARLKALHESGRQPLKVADDDLENALLAEFRNLYPWHRRWLVMLNPYNKLTRLAFTCLALLVLGVAACTTPTSTEVDMGRQYTLQMASATGMPEAGEKMFDELGELEAYLDTRTDIDDFQVMIHETSEGSASIDLLVWGTELDGDSLLAELQERFGDLAGLQISVEPLTGTLEESIGSRMGRAVFDIEVSGATAEEIRQQILAELAAQGLDGDAQVEISDDGEVSTIDITIEASGEGLDGDGAEREDLIIELKQED